MCRSFLNKPLLPELLWKNHRLRFLLLFSFFLILPLILTGCLAYSLDQGGGVVPVVQPEEEDVGDEEKGNEIDPLEQERQERLLREEEERLAAEARRKLEEERREKLGPFYVPLPEEQRSNPPVKARGLYLTGNTVGHPRYEVLLDLIESTELNSVVIDVKNDHGSITYNSEIEIVKEINANRSHPIKDLQAVLEELHEKNIYTIARVVVFKDPYLAEQKPQWAIPRKAGGLWRDYSGAAWINPYERKVWDYNVAVAREAALMGFREIQFDYIRFPENAHRLDVEAYYPGEDLPKDELIRDFLIYASSALEEYNVHISADVFGVIATSWGDSDRIGQTWEEMSPYIDYICPMVYPSHYSKGYFGLGVPDAHPRETVKYALIDSLKRNATLENPAIIRPWLQSFTASWVPGYIPYGPAEVRQQIEVALELGIDEYLIWNANNRYQPASFLTAEDADNLAVKISIQREDGGEDFLGRTPSEAVEIFLDALRRRDWREAFALQITGFELDHRSYPQWKDTWQTRPVFYKVDSPGTAKSEGLVVIELDVHLADGRNEFKLVKENWEVRLENHLWRVKPSAEFLKLLTYNEQDIADNPPALTHIP